MSGNIKKQIKAIQLSMMLGFLSALAHAQTNTPAPDSADWQLVGQAQLKVMFFDIYQSRLYSTTGAYTHDQLPIRLDITYQRNISAKKLLEQTEKEWRHLGIDENAINQWSDHLADLWPDVTKNDVLAFLVGMDGKGTFFYNGTRLETVNDTALARAFLDIWLSPKTSRPEHRQQLIGS